MFGYKKYNGEGYAIRKFLASSNINLEIEMKGACREKSDNSAVSKFHQVNVLEGDTHEDLGKNRRISLN